MKTIFELIRIDTHSKSRYPLRKTKTCDLGLFSTLANAEKLMHRDVKKCQRYEQEQQKDVAANHEIVLAYKITERELDVGYGDYIQSVRTYTAEGTTNDECLLDYRCERHFKGRTPEQIHFQPGDIVEVITSWWAELCVVGHAQPTVEDYENNRQHWLENHKKRCEKWGIEYNEEGAFHWDYSDDCYLVYPLGEDNTHFHPVSPEVFRPTKPVPKSLRDKLRAKYEESIGSSAARCGR